MSASVRAIVRATRVWRWRWLCRCNWPGEVQSAVFVPAGDACASFTPPVNASFVIVTTSGCASLLAAAKAVSSLSTLQGVVLVMPPGAAWEEVGGADDNSDGVNYIVSSVTWEDGQRMLAEVQGGSVGVTYTWAAAGGFFAGIDSQQRVQELGWLKFSTLRFVTWAGQYMEWRDALEASLEPSPSSPSSSPSSSSPPPLLVSLYVNDSMPAYTSAVLPTPKEAMLQGYDRVQLDFTLGCGGTLDEDCNVWDRTVSLLATCSGSDAGDVISGDTSSGGGVQVVEVGRWITSFRRRNGRWLSDVSSIAGVLAGSCNFTVQVDMDVWFATATVRYTAAAAAAASEGVTKASSSGLPVLTVPLVFPNSNWNFDGPEYNANRSVLVAVPSGAQRATLTALISGHGGCEYAPTSHNWAIGGVDFNTTTAAFEQFMAAGSPWGCTLTVAIGSVPNQHGDWQTGRNGWCDALVVAPVVWDVTGALGGCSGGVCNVTYSALVYPVGSDGSNGSDAGCAGYIRLQSFMSFY